MRVEDKRTEKQFRRLRLYCVCGLTQQQIADVEKGVYRAKPGIMLCRNEM